MENLEPNTKTLLVTIEKCVNELLMTIILNS